jgi:hypothetical protein
MPRPYEILKELPLQEEHHGVAVPHAHLEFHRIDAGRKPPEVGAERKVACEAVMDS